MKRIITFLAVFVLATYLFWGCDSVFEPTQVDNTAIQQKAHIVEFIGNLDEGVLEKVAGAGSPTYTDTLSNSTIVEIYGSDITDEAITVAFDYAVINGTPISRILRISQSLEYMVLYDISGEPSSGYVFSGDLSDAYETIIFSGENSISVTHNEPYDPTVTIQVHYNGQLSQAVFTDDAEFDSAMALYDAVYNQGYDPELLTPAELELLERAESVSIWTEVDPQQQTDIETATGLALDSDFQDFSDAGYSPEQPVNKMPEWLNKICKAIRVLKKICTVVNLGIVCEVIEVLVIACAALDVLLS